MVPEIFILVGAVALGIGIGWYMRGRPEASSDADPEMELRELREIHASCGTKIRNLHIELSQLESALAVSGLQTERPASPVVVPVTDDAQAENGAAHLKSIIGALGTDQSEPSDIAEHGPAAFMSILPADIVEESVKGGAADSRPNTEDDAPEPPANLEPVGQPDVVISLVESDEAVAIDVDRTDDLTTIKGIGPKIESILHDEGITTFQQIAELDSATIDRLDDVLGAFRGRIERDDWVGSARHLVADRSVSR